MPPTCGLDNAATVKRALSKKGTKQSNEEPRNEMKDKRSISREEGQPPTSKNRPPLKELVAIVTLVLVSLKDKPDLAVGFGLVVIGLILLLRIR